MADVLPGQRALPRRGGGGAAFACACMGWLPCWLQRVRRNVLLSARRRLTQHQQTTQRHNVMTASGAAGVPAQGGGRAVGARLPPHAPPLPGASCLPRDIGVDRPLWSDLSSRISITHSTISQISNHELSAFGQRRCSIIFFLHIPFPTSQIFRALYCGDELLNVRSSRPVSPRPRLP